MSGPVTSPAGGGVPPLGASSHTAAVCSPRDEFYYPLTQKQYIAALVAMHRDLDDLSERVKRLVDAGNSELAGNMARILGHQAEMLRQIIAVDAQRKGEVIG